jgi:hypothetical protein
LPIIRGRLNQNTLRIMANLNEAGPRVSFQEQIKRALANMEKLKAKGKVQSHSSFWLGDTDRFKESFTNHEKRHSPEYIMQLASIRRGIANFVRITTGREVPIKFSTGQQSYSSSRENNAEAVVISATSDPDKFDVNVGLALHEAAHLCKSKVNKGIDDSIPLFDLLPVVSNEYNQFFTPVIVQEMERLGLSQQRVRGLLKILLNVLEDRRIDKWMYEVAPGYRRYYDALYSFYWMSGRITKLFKNPKILVPSIRTYRFHIVNMMNPAADPSLLPGLAEIYQLIDLDTIERFGFDAKWNTYKRAAIPETRYILDAPTGEMLPVTTKNVIYPFATLPDMVQTALKIIEIILVNCPLEEKTEQPAPHQSDASISVYKKGEGLDEEDDDGDEEEDESPSGSAFDPENLDHGDTGDADTSDADEDGVVSEDEGETEASFPSSEFDNDLDELQQKQNAMLQGHVRKEKIAPELEADLDTLETADVEIKNITGDTFAGTAKVIMYHQFVPKLLTVESFPFGSKQIDFKCEAAIGRGVNMGNMLAHRLKVMADETPITFTRLTQGKLNKRALAGLGYELETVFQQTLTERYAPVYVHLTIDSSNSMKGEKFYNSLALAVSLAQTASRIQTLDVTISFRASGEQTAQVLMAYDSRVDSMVKIHTLFKFLRADGGTPEGLVYAAIKDEILAAAPTSKKYFIILSDGMPYHSWYDELATVDGVMHPTHTIYRGMPAWAHTAEQIRDLRAAEINVLAYYITDGGEYNTKEAEEGFKLMYGRNAKFIDPTSVIAIASTLNRLFLDKD